MEQLSGRKKNLLQSSNYNGKCFKVEVDLPLCLKNCGKILL